MNVFDKYFVAKYIVDYDVQSFEEFVGLLLCDMRSDNIFGWKYYGRLFCDQEFRDYVTGCIDWQQDDLLCVDMDFLRWYIIKNFGEERLKHESESCTKYYVACTDT